MNNQRRIIITGMAILFAAVTVSAFANGAKDSKQNKTICVKSGEEFTLTLESNITTGYQWKLSKLVDNNFLLLAGLKYITNPSQLIGAGGQEEWTFQAVKPGTTFISFEYVRSWEKDVAPAETKNFVVIIK